MSQPSPADTVRAGALPTQRAAGQAPRKRRVAGHLIALVAIPLALGLAVTGLRVTDAVRSARTYSQAERLAVLGQQVTALARAIAYERSDTAAFISDGRPAAGLPALHGQYMITDSRAARVRQLVRQLGHGYPAQTQAAAARALASIAELPGLRRRAAQTQASALGVIGGYTAAASGLFPVSDSIADLSGNTALITSVRALGSLSRMMDQASQQQAILRVALAQGYFGPGALTALSTAQAQQASDLASFRDSATAEESWALSKTLASPLAVQAQAVEQRATAAGTGTLALGAPATQQWWAGMSYTIGWMGQAEQQLTDWITAYTQALQRSAVRSAIVTGGAGLTALLLVLLATLLIARSLVRRMRRLEVAAASIAGAGPGAEVRALGMAGNPGEPVPAALNGGEAGQADEVHWAAAQGTWEQARLRDGAGVISASFFQRGHFLLERLLRLIDSLELSEDDPDRLASLFQMDHLATRIWRNSDSALVLAGHETSRHSAEPLSLVDVLRAAVSEIEQYDRVMLNVQQGVSVSADAATDTVHLLAELLENATRFSPPADQVTVSGYLVRGGGSLISITDSGPGLPEEQLAQLNWQLANPFLADVPETRPVGLLAVAHLAARHDIAVTLSTPPDGGTTAEVFLPAALMSPDAGPGNGSRRPGEAQWAQAGEGAGAWVATGELPFSALRFAAGPEPVLALETGPLEAVPALLSAPLPAAAPAAPAGLTVPEPVGTEPVGTAPVGAEPGEALPIFESVESGYPRTSGRGQPGPGDPEPGQPVRAGQPAAEPASWAAESAEIMRSRLSSFQRGSRRARTNRDAKQPGQDG